MTKRVPRGFPREFPGIMLLDGAVGTELDRRGVTTTLPLWSAIGVIDAPDVVQEIHADYARAGADVLITNTFRTTGRTLAKAGMDPDLAHGLNRRAVDLARDGAEASGRNLLIAGSIAPLEDCYSPDLFPGFDAAVGEHFSQARDLAEAGVDFVMIETMPLAAEAEAALIAVLETGLNATVGFVLGDDGRLLSGESLPDALAVIMPHRPSAIFINCTPAAVIERALAQIRPLLGVPLGAYANFGEVEGTTGWVVKDAVDGTSFAAQAMRWVANGATIIGGCCGTTPAHIAAMRAAINRVAGD